MITRKIREYLEPTIRELDAAGIAWDFESGGKHKRLLYKVGGRTFVSAICSTPSDKRAALNLRRDVRKNITNGESK